MDTGLREIRKYNDLLLHPSDARRWKVKVSFAHSWPTLCDPTECSPPGSSAAKSLQLCLTLCDPIDSSQPGSSVPGILQARILGWVAISFSNARRHAKSLQLCPTLCDPMDTSPTRLLCPQDSPGKHTGVGCHFLLPIHEEWSLIQAIDFGWW